jgi:UDP-N-acetylmuramate dehydrogenase
VSAGRLADDALAADLERALPGRVARDLPVAELTTYRLGGPVSVVVRAGTLNELAALGRVLSTRRVPVLVIGRGSNLLVADAGFAGIGVVLDGTFDQMDIDTEHAQVRAGGAVALPVVARRAAAAGISGLEFLVGIPGSVGGAVHMNAGGHGAETRDVLERAWVFPLTDPERADAEVLDAVGLDLSYRHSNLAPTDVVTMAQLRGTPDDAAACGERIDEIVRWRRDHQPGGANAGSVFRNPVGDSAGRLIDAAGCKGLRVGGAVVSEKHANFFQAEPGAMADDVHRLVRCVQRRVAEHSGVVLAPELRMLGFGPDPDLDGGGEVG